jgi:hypothetical protein
MVPTKQKDASALSLCYSQFPNHYVWDSGQKEWLPRSRGFSLRRITHVHPAAGDLYFIRILLTHQGSDKLWRPRSEEFLELSIQLFNLLAKLWYFLVMIKNGMTLSVKQLHHNHLHNLGTFLSVLFSFCDVGDPMSLFSKFWRFMHDDLLFHLRNAFKMLNL